MAPNPNRYDSIEKLKNRCETYATLGLRNVYATTLTTQQVMPDGYKTGAENMHEAGEIVSQFNLSMANCQIGLSAVVFEVLKPLPGCAI